MLPFGGFFFSLLICYASCASPNCSHFRSCTECIQSTLGCDWCSDPQMPRCMSQSNGSEFCKNLESPQGYLNISEGESFNGSVQLLPLSTAAILRAGEELQFNISIKPASEFPLDIYFLMDASDSMKDDIQTLNVLAENISDTIHSISSDFTIGFGTFVDKPTEPFFTSVPSEGEPALSYGFHNALRLTTNITKFKMAVNSTVTTLNRDSPEGGLDALLQAAVCSEAIGWRPLPTRHIIVYLSDAQFHLGSDGKIVGAVRPHDGQCHLNADSVYEEPLTLDYPSLSMIGSKLQERSIFVVFAVTFRARPDYNDLRSLDILPNIAIKTISEDSSNIISAIESAYYNSISSSVVLQTSVPEGLSVSLRSHCAEGDPPNECSTLSAGNISTFTVSVQLTDCSKVQEEQILKIPLSAGIYGDTVINVEALCECSCSYDKIFNESLCSGNGALVCGLCECNAQSYGMDCQCTEDGNTTSKGTELECRRGSNGEICSGHGECLCAMCLCDSAVGGDRNRYYYGDVCECDNFNCLKDTTGHLCSGHGRCDCGDCVCDPFYTGELCDCYLRDDTCIEPVSNLLCSGYGECTCGQCECTDGYIGEHCTICGSPKICGARQCSNFQDCVTCLYTISGTEVIEVSSSTCPQHCNDLIHQLVFANGSSVTVTPCRAPISTGDCGSAAIMYYVSVEEQGNSVSIFVEKTPQVCTSGAVEPWVIAVPTAICVLIVIFGISILIGIKVLLVVKENLEFKRFQKEAEAARSNRSLGNSNPLFNQAWQEFRCPLYDGEDDKEANKEIEEEVK